MIKLNELFSSIGVQVVNEIGEFRGIGEVMEDLTKRLDKMTLEKSVEFMEKFSEALFPE